MFVFQFRLQAAERAPQCMMLVGSTLRTQLVLWIVADAGLNSRGYGPELGRRTAVCVAGALERGDRDFQVFGGFSLQRPLMQQDWKMFHYEQSCCSDV